MSMLKTEDGRDLSKEEWRVIPEFPKYKITSDGDVRNIRTGKLLVESQNNFGSYFYNLRKDLPNGKVLNAKRNYQGLIWDAFPELRPKVEKKPEVERKKKDRKHIMRGEWRDIPGHSKVQMHNSGGLRYKWNRSRIKQRLDENKVEIAILRRDDNGVRQWTIENLRALVFPEYGGVHDPNEGLDLNWKRIPGHENYEINREGQVRGVVKKELLPKTPSGMYRFRIGKDKTESWCIGDLFITKQNWEDFWNDNIVMEEAA